jgi:hypothetical protein
MKTANVVAQRTGKASISSLFLVICYLLSGCNNLLNVPREAAPPVQDYGTVTISFADSSARTVFPNTVFESCVYTFYNQSNGQFQVKTPGSDGSFALLPGSWSVEVQAYGDPEADDDLAATGASNAFTVTAGQNTPITVPLAGRPETGAGAFKYLIRYPDGTTTLDFAIVKLPEMTPVSFDVPVGGGTEMSGTVNYVPAGFYLVSLRLLHPGGEKGAGKNQVVHIYNALTSEFGTGDAPIAFADEDFAFLPLPAPPAPTVTVTGAGQLGVSWEPVTGATAYELWYGASPAVGSSEKWGEYVNVTTATITGLVSPSYYVWINAKNSNGTSDFSPLARGLFFKSIAAPAELAKIGQDAAWPLSANYALAADIVLENWIPIGAGSAFTGSFDGGNNKITIKSFDAGFVNANGNFGIFAAIKGSEAAAKAQVRNLKVHAELDYADLSISKNYNAGALVGTAGVHTDLDSITLTGTLAFTGGTVYIGGLVGVLNGGELKNSSGSADITVVGNTPAAVYARAGGLVGLYQGGASITYCHAAGNVEISGGANNMAGGIAGGSYYGMSTGYYGKIEDCYFTGNVTASGGGMWSWAGGISGCNVGDGPGYPNSTRIVRCYATGTITARTSNIGWPYVGGIVGYNYYGALVSQCYFTGTVNGEVGNDYTGGIAGYNSQYANHNSIVEDCWSTGTINGRVNGGGIVGQNQVAAYLRRCYSTAAITLSGGAGAKGSSSGDGAGGIVGMNQNDLLDSVTACVALNPSIATAGYELVHRINGNPKGLSYATMIGKQSNNLAWEGIAMTIDGSPVIPDDVGINGKDGQGIAEQKPAEAVYTALGWDFTKVWNLGSDGYPHLRWEE